MVERCEGGGEFGGMLELDRAEGALGEEGGLRERLWWAGGHGDGEAGFVGEAGAFDPFVFI